MLAIIGGSGVVGTAIMPTIRREVGRTPYGAPSSPLYFGEIGGRGAVFLARHGPGHIHPPHKVNYRANIWALRDAGATEIVSLATVGGIADDCPPGAIVIPDQLIDYTYGREHTFFDGGDKQVHHIDFTHPYDRALRERIVSAARASGQTALEFGTYGATQGPRLETTAEISRMARDGCTLVGMTGMPETGLARELELPYAHLCVVANWAAGRGNSMQAISHAAIEATMRGVVPRVVKIIAAVAAQG
jgi:5'-deoxy-5'-methylthioadenosine phosphorylase